MLLIYIFNLNKQNVCLILKQIQQTNIQENTLNNDITAQPGMSI